VTRQLASRSRYRFVGGPHVNPRQFDYECRLVAAAPRSVELATLTDLPRRITIQPRYLGKSIAAFDSDTTTRTCTYYMDDGPPPSQGEHRPQPEYSGMATWDEDREGNVTVTAFDYPG
jgi:hypothetical protein